MKKCTLCQDIKPLDEFGNNSKSKDGKQRYCRECGRASDKKHYANNPNRKKKIVEHRIEARDRNREHVIKHLLENPCVDCGEARPIFLEFDHVCGEKLLDVGSMIHHGWALNSIKEEIKKCEVRCLMCHKLVTAKRSGYFETYNKILASLV